MKPNHREMQAWIIGIACVILLCAVLYEMFRSRSIEGFTSNIVAAEDKSSFFGDYYPKRTDVVPGQTVEPAGWIRDLRYTEQYVDVQGIGLKNDFCRVIMRQDDPGSLIMACALAGTDGTSSASYSTRSRREGFKFSRDDYFTPVSSTTTKKRQDYCRIIKTSQAPEDAWAPMCAPATLPGFDKKEVQDNAAPPDIVTLLWFYDGLMAWYRFKDDLQDYAENTHLLLAGNITIEEDPTKTKTEGLQINAVPPTLRDTPPPAEQFIRIGENEALEFDTEFEIRELRSVAVWAKFDLFTNNARIFDFGNGAGHGNVLLGIEGKGNTIKQKTTGAVAAATAQPEENAPVCNRTAPIEVSPQLYMKKTAANVEVYECPGPEPIDSAVNPADQAEEKEVSVSQANLLFEIWDSEQRKMRIRIVDAIQEGKWHHIVLTTTDTAFRPTWQVYIDGVKIFTQTDGHLPQTALTTKNYIGKSNWEQQPGQGDYKDERFRGSLFDMRFYRVPMSESKVMKTLEWGKALLGQP
jgi:hypothetical protein